MKKILIFLFCILPLSVQAKSDCANGEQNCWDCGKTEADLCTARLNTTTKALSITGTGEVRDYSASWETKTTDAPWGFNYTSVSVDGITSIGIGAFRGNGYGGFTSATISDSVISIGRGAFSENFNLTDIHLGSSIEHLGNYAFGGDFTLSSIFIPDSLLTFGTSDDKGILQWSGVDASGEVSFYCPASKKSVCERGGSKIKTYTKDENGIYQTGGLYYASPDDMLSKSSCGANDAGEPSQKCIEDALKYQNNKAKSMAQNGTLCQTTTGCLKLMDMVAKNENCTTIASCYAYGVDNGILFNDPNVLQNADGSYTLYDEEGNIIGFKGKRIYTIEEATAVVSPKGNTFTLKYR